MQDAPAPTTCASRKRRVSSGHASAAMVAAAMLAERWRSLYALWSRCDESHPCSNPPRLRCRGGIVAGAARNGGRRVADALT